MGDACVIVEKKGSSPCSCQAGAKAKLLITWQMLFPRQGRGAAPKEVAKKQLNSSRIIFWASRQSEPKLDLSERTEFSKKVLSI